MGCTHYEIGIDSFAPRDFGSDTMKTMLGALGVDSRH
jgi:hypothetical protein